MGIERIVSFVIPRNARTRGIHASSDGKFVYVALSGSAAEGPPGSRTPDVHPGLRAPGEGQAEEGWARRGRTSRRPGALRRCRC